MLTIDSYISAPLEIEKELLQCFSNSDKLVIFDIGACEAEDSIKYSRLFPSATIYSFEPLPSNQEKARANLSKYNVANVKLISEALSNQVGSAFFHISSGNPEGLQNNDNWDYGNKSSSLLAPSEEMPKYHQWLKFEEKVHVQTNTLEHFCNQHNIVQIDFAHIDVQGAELMVLIGSGNMLQNIKAVWLEVENVELYKNQPLKNEVEHFMQSKGFINILDKVDHISGDQFYVNLNFFPDAKKRFYHKVAIVQQIKNAIREIFR